MSNYIWCPNTHNKKATIFCLTRCVLRFRCLTIKPEMDKIYEEIQRRWENPELYCGDCEFYKEVGPHSYEVVKPHYYCDIYRHEPMEHYHESCEHFKLKKEKLEDEG